MNEKRLLSLVSLGIVVVALGVLFLIGNGINRKKRETGFSVVQIAPTCTEKGYSLYTYEQNGHTEVKDYVDALGHTFGEWVVIQETDGVDPEIQSSCCIVCGETEEKAVYPELTIDRLCMYGDLTNISKTTSELVGASFLGHGYDFECFLEVKYQGHSSMRYAKKNYTIKFFEDENGTDKKKLEFPGMHREHKYILKANFEDITLVRNLIAADIWRDVTASREDLCDELRSLDAYGAAEGFPVAVYLNDEFIGLYTMNIHRDDDLFDLDDGKRQALLVVNQDTTGEAAFRCEAGFGDSNDYLEDGDWEVAFCGTEDTTWAEEKLNQLIRFVMESDDEEFSERLDDYLDINASIDALLTIYQLGLLAECNEYLTLVTFDGEQWIPVLYNMGEAFGFRPETDSFYGIEDGLPYITEPNGDAESEEWVSGLDNLLWDRMIRCFNEQIRARYEQLRQSAFSDEALEQVARARLSEIPDELYTAEVYTNRNGETINDIQQMRAQIIQYLKERSKVLDNIFLEEK